MARSVATIKAEILAEKNNQSELSSLNSTSVTAIYNLWAYVIAVIINLLEQTWDLFRAEIDLYIANNIPGTVPWYHEQALAFQYGDQLLYINRKFQYAAIDQDKKIVKRVAVKEIYGQVRIKVSTISGGVPCALTAAQEAAFTTYMNRIKFAGTNIAIINYDADLLQIELTVKYDPLVLDSSGTLISDGSTKPVEDAVNEYLEAIVYGGVFNKTHLIDAVQIALGVVDPICDSALGKANGAGSYSAITHEYEAVAGYMVIDTLTVNYVANV